jgi:hypothetical protein
MCLVSGLYLYSAQTLKVRLLVCGREDRRHGGIEPSGESLWRRPKPQTRAKHRKKDLGTSTTRGFSNAIGLLLTILSAQRNENTNSSNAGFHLPVLQYHSRSQINPSQAAVSSTSVNQPVCELYYHAVILGEEVTTIRQIELYIYEA